MIELPTTPQIVAVDTETTAVVSIAWQNANGQIESAAYPFDQGPRDKPEATPTLFDGDDPNLDEGDWHTLMQWLSERQLIMHNAKFDLHMLRHGTRHWQGHELETNLNWDTMIAQSVLDPHESQALKTTATRLWGEDQADEKRILDAALRNAKGPKYRYDLLPWETIEPYARKDAELTYRLWQHQQQRLDQGEYDYQQIHQAIKREMALLAVLYRMERRGLGYDIQASLEIVNQLTTQRETLATTLPYTATVNAAKRWYFGDETNPGRYLAYSGRTPSGAFSLDDEVLRKMVSDELPHAATWDQITRIDKAVSMWYRGYADLAGADGRLRTSYRQTKVKSGRMSVERVQLQAIPKTDKHVPGAPHVRSLFRSKPGTTLYNLDLSQAELRVAARYSGCTTMLDLLLQGADMHGYTCTQVLGTQPDDPNWKRDRDIAKRLTFGSIFMIGGRKFQSTLKTLANIELSEQRCTEIVDGWRRTYPEFGHTYRRLDKIAERYGWVWLLPDPTRGGPQKPGPSSRRSYFEKTDWTHTAWSRTVQGSLAEFNKIWLHKTEQWLHELDAPEALVLNVHDSVVLELPDNTKGEAIANEIAKRGGELATHIFKIGMHIDISPWYEEQNK